MEFNSAAIESKWKKLWEEQGTYCVRNDSTLPKYYVLDMFPYPSGSGLHVGHPLGYIASDIYSRYKRMCGFNVLHPMGFDAFGLPAEQYAIQNGIHPAVSTEENIKRYRSQLDNIGFSYDWSREVRTSDPEYYKWTQWIFKQLYLHYYDTSAKAARPIDELISHFSSSGTNGHTAFGGEELSFSAEEWANMTLKAQADVLMNFRLAYRKTTFVNWCEELGTVLANDEVIDGRSERGGYPVEKKPMLQWSLRITAYAERLLNDMKDLEWSDALKSMQENWIGKSQGAQIFFNVESCEDKIEVFTTRPDTIFGATFMVLAPEHPLVASLTTEDHKEEIDTYLKYVKGRSERQRQSEVKIVSGAFTGAYAIHPFTSKKIPIWIAEYVLLDYGTGAIMAVPGDDERDQRFAEKFGIKIIDVVDRSNYPEASIQDKVGRMINSEFLNGMEVKEAIEATIRRLESLKIGKRRLNYRLRDANYSRQRYWGEPFPIVYDENDVPSVLSDDELPLTLPELEDFKPASGGQSPLARKRDWVELEDGRRRETDTMPGFAGSSWYFLRYMDPHNKDAFASREALDYWRDVDLYIGGTEHAVGHLMYSRFWHKFLYDKGLVPTVEPFKKLVNQGMIQGTIESIFLKKDKTEGRNHFMCAGLVKAMGLENDVDPILMSVEFVKNYGEPNSYLNIEGIKRFIDWRPEYADAIFECSKGVYRDGIFTSKSEAKDSYLVTHSEVGKMSKSKYNVINPDLVVEQYGADCFRMYEMFLGPIEQSKPWDTKGIDGVQKFVKRYWSLFFQDGVFTLTDETPEKEDLKILHQAIKKVTFDVERFSFNTCISAFMIAANELRKRNCNNREILLTLNDLLAPFAPFITEEIHALAGKTTSVHLNKFPEHDEQYLTEDEVTYPISINGKKRAEIQLDANMSKDDIEVLIREHEVVKKWSDGKDIKRVIVVPGRMVNVVV